VKRLALIVGVVIVVAATFELPATGQDNHEERISSLETRVAVLEQGSLTATSSPTASNTPTPRPTSTATPTPVPVSRLVLTGQGTASQRSRVDLMPGTWDVVLEVEPDTDGFVFVNFIPDSRPEGRRFVIEELVTGDEAVTLRATVRIDDGLGEVIVDAKHAAGWILTMERA